MLENGANQPRFLGAPGAADTFDAQWNDDVHHCLHVDPDRRNGRLLRRLRRESARHVVPRASPKASRYQGETSAHEGSARGEPQRAPAAHRICELPAESRSDRQSRLRRAAQRDRVLAGGACVRPPPSCCWRPSPPMLFMGEEWQAPAAVPLLLRLRAGARAEGARRPQTRIRALREVQRSRRGSSRIARSDVAEATSAPLSLDWSVLQQREHADCSTSTNGCWPSATRISCRSFRKIRARHLHQARGERQPSPSTGAWRTAPCCI